MNKKLIIIAGVILAVFVIFLIAICGGASGNKIITQEELKTMVTDITCEIKNEENIKYDLSTITNDIYFDSEIKEKQYTKIVINKANNFKSLGVAFIAKSNADFNLVVSLNKNGVTLKTTTLTFENNQIVSANLLLDNSVEINKEDIFTITFEQTTDFNFVFDTFVFFFDGD